MKDQKLTFAKAYEELEQITQQFESGDIDLEAAIPQFKRATHLAKYLKTRLAQLDNEVKEISLELDEISDDSSSVASNQDDLFSED
jgi:exodeoxyribonuclease VII small subunit